MQSIKDYSIDPLRIDILGDYWDSQIYKGRLYLWTMEGTILIIDWDRMIKSIADDKDKQLAAAIETAFANSDILYSNKQIANFFRALNYKEVFHNALRSLNNEKFIITEKKLTEFVINKIQCPAQELPTDLDIYYDDIYTIIDSGLWKYNINYDKCTIVKGTESKIWDCRLLNLKVKSGGRVALSGGSEGLFEYNIWDKNINSKDLKKVDNFKNIYHLSSLHSLFSNWSFSSIYSSSDVEESFMAAFNWNKSIIDYKGIFSEKDIFGENNDSLYLSWGSEDKVYKASENGLEVVRFTQSRLDSENKDAAFSNKKIIEFNQWKGQITSAGVALFGAIIELENALVVLQSNDEYYTIPGPITKWRVFPRSKKYENHLHLVFNNRISVYSFNHDYFIDQQKKYFGTKRNFSQYFNE